MTGKPIAQLNCRGTCLVPAVMLFLCLITTQRVIAAESTEESMAAYADAANFQTNGALPLAIDAWKAFLKDYADDPMASKAAHYLGVCLMQREQPDYAAAADAFGLALKDKEYELREESLANQGWCLYAAAGEGQERDKEKLKASMEAFAQLRKESPESKYLDRALFYSGEAAYGMSQPKQAIGFYDELLNLPSAKDSPLRCDAFYARGVALEEIDEFEKAIASYRQLLDQCAKGDLVTDVHLRLGDLLIMRKQFDDAVKSFAAAIESTESAEDSAYALFRQGFALVQAEKAAEAAVAYDRLAKEYPDSKYAASATLASAQSAYRGGKMEMAEKRFAEVLNQSNPAAATEAAHWLARISLSRNDPAAASKIAKQQLEGKLDGEFVVALKLDYAEALSLDPKTLPASVAAYEQAYKDHPKDPLAPRALYNAAFSAMQTGKFEQATKLTDEFEKNFSGHALAQDVMFVAAESQLLSGQGDKAAGLYARLLAKEPKDNAQRPLWILRSATNLIAIQQAEEALTLLKQETAKWTDKRNLAEAKFHAAQANLALGKPELAAKEFDACYEMDPKWPRADEARLLAAQAKVASGNRDDAVVQWKKIISDDPKGRMAAQARYKLAQLASTEGTFDRSIELYDEVLAASADPGLYPYAQYGKAWSLLQIEKRTEAIAILDELLREFASHPVAAEALLARGVSLRREGKQDRALEDLEAFLKYKPQGLNLGHALYELALVEQKRGQPAKAAKHLEQIVTAVPSYPAMAKVLYEWAWLLNETGAEEAAVEKFKKLLEKYPNDELSSEAAFFVGQRDYAKEDWKSAANYFIAAAKSSRDPALTEKSYYRLGWSYFKLGDFAKAAEAFQAQATKLSGGALVVDALMMVGESRFKMSKFEDALVAYEAARERIREKDESAKTLRDPAERQVRELVLLHGGQSAAQLKRWDESLKWYDELRQRFPATGYLPQVFYETGFTHQQLGDNEKAMKFFTQVADNYRNEIAARARFMMGELHFAERRLDQAITDFQRVMYGFGADKAPAEFKNWQAKSGFEAGRCSELLIQQAQSSSGREKAKQFATTFFQYVIDKHPGHELAGKSRERLENLRK